MKDCYDNYVRFIEKVKSIRKENEQNGKDSAACERACADYFGMSLTDFRSACSAALKARRAWQVFTVRYFDGVHPDVPNEEVAKRLGLPEIFVEAIRKTK